MTDGTSISPEIMVAAEHSLNDIVLVHGFLGNIDKREDVTLSQVIIQGSLVSPNRRPLDITEERRYAHTAPFDRKRLTFHAWKPGGLNSGVYIGRAAWAAPVTALEGTIVGDDIAMQDGDIFAYQPDGVDISLQRGLLYISDELLDYETVTNAISKRSTQEGLTPHQWIENNVVIVPKEIFQRPNGLLGVISRRITPSRSVKADFVTASELNSQLKLEFTAILDQKHKPAPAEDLGEGTKTAGDSITPEVISEWSRQCLNYEARLNDIEQNIETNPFRLEELKPSRYMYDEGWWFSSLKRRVSNFIPNSDLQQKVLELEKKRDELRTLNEKVLESRYPNMPKYDHEPNNPNYVVYRDKSYGEIRVHTPI